MAMNHERTGRRAKVEPPPRVDENALDFIAKINAAALAVVQDKNYPLRKLTKMVFHNDESGCITVEYESGGQHYSKCVMPDQLTSEPRPVPMRAIVIESPGDEYQWGVSTAGHNPPPEHFAGFASREAADEVAALVNNGMTLNDALAKWAPPEPISEERKAAMPGLTEEQIQKFDAHYEATEDGAQDQQEG